MREISDIKNLVVLVDSSDNEIGAMEKMEAHLKGSLHRAISVLVFNSKGEWLLQRRNPEKYHSKGLWSNTCCTHPFPGESYMDAANRRLLEEMGLCVNLKDMFSFIYKTSLEAGLTEHELDHVFVGVCDTDPVINRVEVVEYRWITSEDLMKELKDMPEKYTEWFKLIVKKYIKYA